VDVVFDRYDKPFSIKGNERERRGSSSALEIKIIGPSTPVPKQWNKYISNPQNKGNLTAFLSNTWCQMSQQELHHGQVLVLGGGFKECNKAVLVVKGLIDTSFSAFAIRSRRGRHKNDSPCSQCITGL